MSTINTSRFCEDNHITRVTITPDALHPNEYAEVVTDHPQDEHLTPGFRAKVRTRVWQVVLQHRHDYGEAAVLLDEEPWTFAYHPTGPDTGSWHITHPSCRLAKYARKDDAA